MMVRACCDVCMCKRDVPAYPDALGLGWTRKHSEDPFEIYGWRCPACPPGAPLRLPKRPKRSR